MRATLMTISACEEREEQLIRGIAVGRSAS